MLVNHVLDSEQNEECVIGLFPFFYFVNIFSFIRSIRMNFTCVT